MKAAHIIFECGVYVCGGILLCEFKLVNGTGQVETQPWVSVFDFRHVWKQGLWWLFSVYSSLTILWAPGHLPTLLLMSPWGTVLADLHTPLWLYMRFRSRTPVFVLSGQVSYPPSHLPSLLNNCKEMIVLFLQLLAKILLGNMHRTVAIVSALCD